MEPIKLYLVVFSGKLFLNVAIITKHTVHNLDDLKKVLCRRKFEVQENLKKVIKITYNQESQLFLVIINLL